MKQPQLFDPGEPQETSKKATGKGKVRIETANL